MDNRPPAFVPLAFAVFMAVMSFIYIRYAERIKHWKDNYTLFEFQRQINRGYTVKAYRNVGWSLAVGSVLMVLLSLVLFLIQPTA